MTLDEALQELGIERSASPEEARRAYLRGVKTRKPESDPEGFRRLREAYELVSGALRSPASDAAPAEVQPEDGPDGEDWDDEEAAPPELVNLAAQLSALPAETRLEQLLALLRQTVQEHPGSSGVRWWLVEELNRAGREQELLATLLGGEAAGFPGFLETRAARFPGTVEENDLARLEQSSDLDAVSVAAKVYLQQSKSQEAVATLNRVIDRLEAHEDPATRPVLPWLARMLLTVEAAGLTADARALHDRLWQWLSDTGDPVLLQRWGMIHVWKVAHELGQLDPSFPAELRQAAALAALTGDIEPAVEKAKRLTKADSKKAEHFSTMLYDLPMLYGLYYRILQGIWHNGPVQQKERRSSGVMSLLWILAVLAVNVFTRCPSETPTYRFQNTRSDALWKESSAVWATLSGACDGMGSAVPLRKSSCDIMRRAIFAMDAGDCQGARTALRDLEADIHGSSPKELAVISEFEGRAFLAITTSCGSYQVTP